MPLNVFIVFYHKNFRTMNLSILILFDFFCFDSWHAFILVSFFAHRVTWEGVEYFPYASHSFLHTQPLPRSTALVYAGPIFITQWLESMLGFPDAFGMFVVHDGSIIQSCLCYKNLSLCVSCRLTSPW